MRTKLIPIAAFAALFAFAGCTHDNRSAKQKAGDETQGAMDHTAHGVSKAGEKTGEGLDKAANKTGDGLEKAADKTGDVAHNATH